MPVDFYPQKSIEELTTILAGLQSRQLKGTITEVNVAGVRPVGPGYHISGFQPLRHPGELRRESFATNAGRPAFKMPFSTVRSRASYDLSQKPGR